MAMPPLPRALPLPRPDRQHGSSTATLDQQGVVVEPRVGGEQPVEVGEQHQHVGADEVGDERGDAVVVAVADLVVGDARRSR